MDELIRAIRYGRALPLPDHARRSLTIDEIWRFSIPPASRGARSRGIDK